MFQKKKSRKQFSFDIKIPNTNSQKKFRRNNSNSKEPKDIFIRKQDIYLIKLLEKRIKLTKMYKSKKLSQNIKVINPWNYKINPDENKTSHIVKKNENQSFNYKNIKIKFNKKQSEENSYINYGKDKNNTINLFDDLITSKIFNSDNSKNNKNILKIINRPNKSYKNDLLDIKYLNNKSIIKLPKINQNKGNKNIRNFRNITNSNNSFYESQTISMRGKKNHENYITLYERDILKDNKKKFSIIDFAKRIQNNNYKIFSKDKRISPIKDTKQN